MISFEEYLAQYKPMIYACMRKLNIYKNHEQFKQAGVIALWKAWVKFDQSKGDFAPYAYRCIYGSMLDELKKEKRIEETINPMEEEKLTFLLDQTFRKDLQNEELGLALEQLTRNELNLVLWLYVEGISLQEAANRAGITISGIKKRRERLLQKMREFLIGMS